MVVLVAVLVVAAGATGYLVTKHFVVKKQPAAAAFSTRIVDACTVLTQATAEELLGPTAKKGDTAGFNLTPKGDNMNISNCTYSVNTNIAGATDTTKITSLSVLASSAKTSVGAESNKAQFGASKPAGADTVTGLGDGAFWDQKVGQLNILKGNNWYILSRGSGPVTDRKLDDAKKFANEIVTRL